MFHVFIVLFSFRFLPPWSYTYVCWKRIWTDPGSQVWYGHQQPPAQSSLQSASGRWMLGSLDASGRHWPRNFGSFFPSVSPFFWAQPSMLPVDPLVSLLIGSSIFSLIGCRIESNKTMRYISKKMLPNFRASYKSKCRFCLKGCGTFMFASF